ncbi:GNAT family N-acetyltransferase [Streptomyces sp. T-3]|nr:GNAT family N-acetyltransferase [Streptomyces sp. T-3]
MMVIEPYRRRGIAKLIHDEPLAHREETTVSLMVSPANQHGRMQVLYARWGYQEIGESQPSPDSPPLTVTVHPLRLTESPDCRPLST